MSVSKKELQDAIMQAIEIEKETFDLYTKAEADFQMAGQNRGRALSEVDRTL